MQLLLTLTSPLHILEGGGINITTGTVTNEGVSRFGSTMIPDGHKEAITTHLEKSSPYLGRWWD